MERNMASAIRAMQYLQPRSGDLRQPRAQPWEMRKKEALSPNGAEIDSNVEFSEHFAPVGLAILHSS
jgi:hypothetical protein